MTGARQDTWRVHVSIDGDDYGVWDKKTGGGVDSTEKKYKPGGMVPEVTLGGSRTVNNITLSRLYDLQRDHHIINRIINKCGNGRVVAKQQPLDYDGNPFGDPIVYTGMLKACTPPEVDSEGGDAAMVEIEVSTAGDVG